MKRGPKQKVGAAGTASVRGPVDIAVLAPAAPWELPAASHLPGTKAGESPSWGRRGAASVSPAPCLLPQGQSWEGRAYR